MAPSDRSTDAEPPAWKARWIARRNRILASPRFQNFAAAFPLTRPVARRRAARLFDLTAGFVYSQVLAALVETDLFAFLGERPRTIAAIGEKTNLSPDATERLLRAAASLDLVESVGEHWWTLGQQGAALSSNAGALAMIRHHHLLYADLADPLALLRADRGEETALSRYWSYARSTDPAHGMPGEADAYSALMAASQQAVSAEILAAYNFGRHRRLLDIGGGEGAFLSAVGAAHPTLQLGLFDIPDVAARAEARLAERGFGDRVAIHGGNFHDDSFPAGFDCISLVRILHDHDDASAQNLLRSIHTALPEGGRLVIAEPMAGTKGAEAMGDAYFGLYLWAMGSGRPRTAKEIRQLLRNADFKRAREIRTGQPLITRIIIATA